MSDGRLTNLDKAPVCGKEWTRFSRPGLCGVLAVCLEGICVLAETSAVLVGMEMEVQTMSDQSTKGATDER